MKLYIDEANIDLIKEVIEYYPIDGVTTNPSILAKAEKDPIETLKAIRRIIGPDQLLFAQAVGKTYKEMIDDAYMLVRLLGINTVVKIPSTQTGFKAMRKLRDEGFPICGTVVYTPMQAYIAAKCGANFVAPYVNRIDNMGFDGVDVVKQIQNILVNNKMDCELLAASFKNSQQVLELAEYGIANATCSGDVIKAFANNPAIEAAVDDFISDFKTKTNCTSMQEFKKTKDESKK